MSEKSTLDKIIAMSKRGNHKYSREDIERLRTEGERETSQAFVAHHESHRSKSIVGRSGILPIHQGCTVDNYKIEYPDLGQTKAAGFARSFIKSFNENKGRSFFFSGTEGTGKNHLSAAICNELMTQNKTCLIITVSELMMRLNKCYGNNPEMSEDQFYNAMIKLDLMIIDEIGLGRTRVDAANNERLALNQIIDKRLGHLKPTGLLTNLGQDECKEYLGIRIMGRMRANKGHWIDFNWPSYRK